MAYYVPPRWKNEILVYSPVAPSRRGNPMCRDRDFMAKYKSSKGLQSKSYIKGLDDCSLFEHPYFSPSHMALPVNYNTRLPHWTDSRRTKDWLANWGNELVRNDRAFGKWHNLFGYHYGYGDNRRL